MSKQIRDELEYNGQAYLLDFSPVESYFSTYPEKMPKVNGGLSTLERGFVAEYLIEGDLLFLRRLEFFRSIDEWEELSETIFPKGQKLNWFSGYIHIDEKNVPILLKDEKSDFRLLQIEKGVLKQELSLNYQGFQEFCNPFVEQYKQRIHFEELSRHFGKNELNGTSLDEFEFVIRRTILEDLVKISN